MKRLVDILVSAVALAAVGPLLAVAALAVRLSSPGPLIYRARRVGRGGREFTMFKLRTMHTAPPSRGSTITAAHDPRVFPVGRLLRATKIDELPQLLNVLRGEMSLVGPRPEDPEIVRTCYTRNFEETLSVRPGLASPGSIYNYTHAERLLGTANPEADYVARVLAVKLALDTVYVRRASLLYDMRIIGRTLRVISAAGMGRRLADPPELPEARQIVAQWSGTG